VVFESAILFEAGHHLADSYPFHCPFVCGDWHRSR
jgi:hypothetical protein